MKASQYSEYIDKLDKDEKLYFYETLAHYLTISIREMWSNADSSENEIIEQIKYINEILHRVTSKIKVERLMLHEWTESDFIKMINHYVKICPTIGGAVAYAIEYSYETTLNKQKS